MKKNTNYNILPTFLAKIVDSEAKARACYEEILVSHPSNTSVLRSYARLMLDIYHDEENAEVIL
jgi:hypothetical protein